MFSGKKSKRKEEVGVNFLFYNYGKKSGFYSGILLDFEGLSLYNTLNLYSSVKGNFVLLNISAQELLRCFISLSVTLYGSHIEPFVG